MDSAALPGALVYFINKKTVVLGVKFLFSLFITGLTVIGGSGIGVDGWVFLSLMLFDIL